MVSLFPACVLLLCSSLPYSHQVVTGPLQLVQSENSYGPDGPWHAVSVVLGDPGQRIDLYPAGSSFGSLILTNSVCDGITDKPCGSGGTYYPTASKSAGQQSISWQHISDTTTDGNWTGGALLYQYSNASYGQDNLILNSENGERVEDVDLYRFFNVSMKYPDGTLYPMQVGQLALGNTDTNQSFTTNGGVTINGTLVPNYLHDHNIIPSSSYGLHYGSAALNLDLSLWLGGYDQTRVLSPVASQSYSSSSDNTFRLTLRDITLGVDQGASPFNYSTRERMLAEGNDSIGDGVQVILNPGAPYLNLPNSTCQVLARDLPVTYNWKYGLYLWNESDPQYHRIVTSPTYLSFIFDTQNPVNLTIKVPFLLLNLKLDAPLTATPTHYFPCQPPQDPNNQQYGLGRAFLQAAFIGVRWSGVAGQWYLAQAPGPGVTKTPNQVLIENGTITDTPIKPYGIQWADTWQNHWTPLQDTTNTTSSPQAFMTGSPKTTGTSLAGGAIAGIAIGVVVVILICLAIGLCVHRRRKSPGSTPSVEHLSQQDIKNEHMPDADKDHSVHATGHEEPLELHNETFVVPTPEISGSERYEMRQLPSPQLRSELS